MSSIRSVFPVDLSLIITITLIMLAEKHRSLLLRFGPSVIVELGWWIWALLDIDERLEKFTEQTPYIGQFYLMSITMVFGSMVAGATSEGGGAVGFPVMTLLLQVPPIVARDFSFAIQSFGMSCAAITIVGIGMPLDLSVLVWTSLGGAVGLISGLVGVAPFLPPAYAKLFFVTVWMTFAVALFRLNTTNARDRTVHMSSKLSDIALSELSEQQDSRTQQKQNRRAVVLFITGMFGGICCSIAGSGLDIASFSVVTLYYRVSEKVATPTSVLLMAINSILGVICRTWWELGGTYAPGQKAAVWDFVSVCVPIVVIGAPFGATVSAKLPRHVLSYLLYILDTVQFVTALAIIQPWSKPFPHNIGLCVEVAVIAIVGSVFFWSLANWGRNRADCSDEKLGKELEEEEEEEEEATA